MKLLTLLLLISTLSFSQGIVKSVDFIAENGIYTPQLLGSNCPMCTRAKVYVVRSEYANKLIGKS
jgi:hypothetical protein